MNVYFESGRGRNAPILVYMEFGKVQLRIRKSLRGVEISFSVAGDLKQSCEGCQLLPQLTPQNDVNINVTLINDKIHIDRNAERMTKSAQKKDVFSRLKNWFSQMYDVVSKLGDFLNGTWIILIVLKEAVSVLPPFF